MKNLLYKLFVGLGVTKAKKQSAFSYPNPIPRLRAALEQSDTEKDVQRLFEIAMCLNRYFTGSDYTLFRISCYQQIKLIRLANKLEQTGIARTDDVFTADELFAIELLVNRHKRSMNIYKYMFYLEFLKEHWHKLIERKAGTDKLFTA